MGSIVQKGKFADCALAFDKQLKRVDLPTLGKPTIPHCKDILSLFLVFDFYSATSPSKVAAVALVIVTCTKSPIFRPALGKTTILFCDVRPQKWSRDRLE